MPRTFKLFNIEKYGPLRLGWVTSHSLEVTTHPG